MPRSTDRDSSSRRDTTGRLEIRIANDRAERSRSRSRSRTRGYQQQDVVMPQDMSSPSTNPGPAHRRAPAAVMDLYTGRHARPSLEPYRPPPMAQQFYRSLADSTPTGQIPQDSPHLAGGQPAYHSSAFHGHGSQFHGSPAYDQQRYRQAPSAGMRKPFN